MKAFLEGLSIVFSQMVVGMIVAIVNWESGTRFRVLNKAALSGVICQSEDTKLFKHLKWSTT